MNARLQLAAPLALLAVAVTTTARAQAPGAETPAAASNTTSKPERPLAITTGIVSGFRPYKGDDLDAPGESKLRAEPGIGVTAQVIFRTWPNNVMEPSDFGIGAAGEYLRGMGAQGAHRFHLYARAEGCAHWLGRDCLAFGVGLGARLAAQGSRHEDEQLRPATSLGVVIYFRDMLPAFWVAPSWNTLVVPNGGEQWFLLSAGGSWDSSDSVGK